MPTQDFYIWKSEKSLKCRLERLGLKGNEQMQIAVRHSENLMEEVERNV